MSRLLTITEAERFKKIIDEYKPNQDVLEKFKSSNFAVIAGPAGAGKDTLRNSLIKKYPEQYVPILSTTTRPRRTGEIDGKAYHFSTVEGMEEGFKNGDFFEAAIVHNQQLSTLHINEIDKLNPNQFGLSILIVQTEKELRALNPNIKTIFVIPPTLDLLLERIKSNRKLDAAEITRRLSAAKTEISVALNTPEYYCLVSETVEHITAVAHSYLHEDTREHDEDMRARRIMGEIYKSLID